MYCGKCGSAIPDGNSFCSKCGAPISQVTPQVIVTANPQQASQTSQTDQPRTTPLRVIESIIVIAFAIIIMIVVLRACTSGMFQMGLL